MKRCHRALAVASGIILSTSLIAVPAWAEEETSPAESNTTTTAYASDLAYEEVTTPYKETVTIELSGSVPEGTRFHVSSQKPAGWDYSVDEKGTLTVTPDETRYEGAMLKLPVLLQFPDESTQRVTAFVKVGAPTHPIADEYDAAYDDLTIEQNSSATAKPKGEYPEGTTFIVNEDPIQGWTVAGDKNTGEITVTAPKGAAKNSGLHVGVIVVYPDHSTDRTTLTVTVGEPSNPESGQHDFAYDNATVKAGETVTFGPKTALPEGARVIGPTDEVGKWAYEVNEDGTVSVTAPASSNPGSALTLGLVVRYADGSTATTSVKVSVAK